MKAQPILTDRLALEPLMADHANELHKDLNDDTLHEFTGDHPTADLTELRKRYSFLANADNHPPGESWLNWAIRLREGRAIGTVQATVHDDCHRAELAWVIAVPNQGQGYASEASLAMLSWLRASGIKSFEAHIAEGHLASEGLAAAIGLHPTDRLADGERVWEIG